MKRRSSPVRRLISETRLRSRVRALARTIRRDYRDRDLLIVGVLRGAFVFMADLVRAIDLPLTCDFLRASSYNGTTSSGRVRLDSIPPDRVEGRHVLLVEDIVDTGLTSSRILREIRAFRPASLKLCSLLVKEVDRHARIRVDYVGFTIPDCFVVGYGLDHDGRYRNLPYLGVLKAGD